jgi:hypothetical protein
MIGVGSPTPVPFLPEALCANEATRRDHSARAPFAEWQRREQGDGNGIPDPKTYLTR